MICVRSFFARLICVVNTSEALIKRCVGEEETIIYRGVRALWQAQLPSAAPTEKPWSCGRANSTSYQPALHSASQSVSGP